ncbi:O-antigen ligase family protein [Alphaproteobacteria bacterium]|nr:O-antigen ligase family protein [Alphaproteobacteria bacterium]
MLKKEKIREYAYKFLILTIVPIAVLAPVGTWLPFIICGFLLFIYEEKKLNFFIPKSNIDILIYFFFLYISLSLIWSNNHYEGCLRVLELVVMYLCLKQLLKYSSVIKSTITIKNYLFFSLLFSYFILIIDLYFLLGIKNSLSLIVESIKEGSITFSHTVVKKGTLSGTFNRGLAVLLLFSLIGVQMFWKQKSFLFFIIVGTSLCIYLGESFTLKIAGLLSIFALLLMLIFKKRALNFFIFSVLGSLLLFPFIMEKTISNNWNQNKEIVMKKKIQYAVSLNKIINEKNKYNLLNYKYLKLLAAISINRIKDKAFHRLVIWDYTSKEIKKKPIIGHGFYSSRKHGEKNYVSLIIGTAGCCVKHPAIPLHPHNQILQLYFELGLIGIVFISFLYFFLLKKLQKMIEFQNFKTYLNIIIFLLIFLINLSSFGVWQTWWLAVIGTLVVYVNIILQSKKLTFTTK